MAEWEVDLMRQKKTKANLRAQIVDESGNLATLVDQVIAEGAPIVVARGGEPKAALVSIEDYTLLQQGAQRAAPPQKVSWEEWSREARQLREDILAHRKNSPINLDLLIEEMREELGYRDAYHSGS
jgi:prevent-host-death family protein